ncbi:MAG: hypothetical protein U9Q92_01115, partial [archaeon]|nr:hypothetical protein [archaeon]
LEMEKNADRYQSVLSDILEKGTPTKNEKKTLQKMNGALSFVGMSVKPEYGTNGKPTEGYIKELSSKLKGFKELMK